MTLGPLQSLFERIFGNSERSPADGGQARQVALLAAHLAEAPGAPPSAGIEPSVADLAAYLDGGLTEESRRALEGGLAASAPAFEEAASAAAFVDALAAERQAAPADLLAACRTPYHAEPGKRGRARGRSWFWRLAGVGIALAAAAVVTVLITGPGHAPGGPKAPIIASPLPPSHPTMVPVGAAERVPSPERKPPPLAPETPEAVPARR